MCTEKEETAPEFLLTLEKKQRSRVSPKYLVQAEREEEKRGGAHRPHRIPRISSGMLSSYLRTSSANGRKNTRKPVGNSARLLAPVPSVAEAEAEVRAPEVECMSSGTCAH